ncbi:Nucleoporin-like protein 2, partial [Lonchura striata]
MGTQAAPAFGMGGQPTSGFGLSSFPVSSSSTSASSFSFKTSSSLISSASSGSSPAADGRSAAAANPPAFGTTSSPSAPQSVGFGSPAAPSAASFSFKAAATAGGFGTSGFSGFGSAPAGNSASTTPAAFGTFGATVPTSASPLCGALFGQSTGASGHPVTSASAAATTSSPASEKLFTPKSELSAEEWQQFEAKEFTIGKIPLKPPPLELLNAFDRCWNQHPRGPPPAHVSSGRGGGWGTSNQRYSNVIQPSSFKSDTWGGSRDHGRGFFGSSDFGSSGGSSRNADFSQNRFSALANSQSVADGSKDEEERLIECVVKDMEIWESSGQWIFSCYSPMKEKPNVSGFSDVSPEELRLEYYDSRANNIIGNYIDAVQKLALQWKNRLLQLKAL